MIFYMFRTVSLSLIRSLFTVHSAMVYVIRVCGQFPPGPDRQLSTIPFDIYHCWVYSE